ncbi:hypothetical protein VTK56DRAFT_1278 [Thermocarpiscus australiensis]
MPFDFKAYDAKCAAMTPEELQLEWQHYTRLISGASTSTAVSGLAVPLTLGVSLIGVGVSAPAIHNARKKREIIEKHLQRHGTTHHTRKRDVLSSVALSRTIGAVTLGVGAAGADAIATAGAEHGISAVVENEMAIKIVTHAALDGAGMAVEHAYTDHKKKKEAHRAFQAAGVFQAVADAKAREAGYAVSPYNPQGYNVQSSSGMTQAQPPYGYGYGYGYVDQTQPPPPYCAAVAPPGFVTDTKTPAMFGQGEFHARQPGVPTTQVHLPCLYGQQAPAPPRYNANPSSASLATSNLPVFSGPDQQGHGYERRGGIAEQQAGYNHDPPQSEHGQQLVDPTPTLYPPTQNPSQAYTPYPVHQQHQQQTGQPRPHEQHIPEAPQASQVAVPNSVRNSVHGAFDMRAMTGSLPATTPVPIPEPQHAEHHQQPPSLIIPTTQSAQVQAQPQAQSVSQPLQEQCISAPSQPASTTPETPVLHAPRPASVYHPASGPLDFGVQPTTTPGQSQQHPQQTQPSIPQQPSSQPAQISSQEAQQPDVQPSHSVYASPGGQEQGGHLPYQSGTPQPPPPPPQRPSSYESSSFRQETKYQGPAAALYFPPPPQTPIKGAAYASPASDISSANIKPPVYIPPFLPPPICQPQTSAISTQSYVTPGAYYAPPSPLPIPQPQRQQKYVPTPQQYQPPIYQHVQTQQAAYQLPPTPLSPPSGQQPQQDYFPAYPNSHCQLNTHPQQWNAQNARPQWQSRYTPAATPSSGDPPEGVQGYPAQ